MAVLPESARKRGYPDCTTTMIPDHGMQYEENPSSHHGRMGEDGHPDGWSGPFPIFPHSAQVERGLTKQ